MGVAPLLFVVAPSPSSKIYCKNDVVSLKKKCAKKKTYLRRCLGSRCQDWLFAATCGSYRCGSGARVVTAGSCGDRVVVVEEV